MEEEVKPVEEVVAEPVVEEAKQEELPLAAAEEKPAAEPEKKVEEKPAEEVNKDLPIWARRELGTKQRQIRESKQREAELLAEIETKNAMLAKFNQAPAAEIQAVPVDEVEKRVQERFAQEKYLEQSQKVAKAGEDTYKESWKEAVFNLEALGGFDQGTMNGILATGDDAPRVLFELGKSPDKYHQIMGLPFEKRLLEIGKLAMQPVTKQISNAPAPVNPVGGRAAPAKDTLSDNMDDDKWFSIRRAQRRAKFEAAHSPRR